jgi:superoxide dismutase, Fe-Mn family
VALHFQNRKFGTNATIPDKHQAEFVANPMVDIDMRSQSIKADLEWHTAPCRNFGETSRNKSTRTEMNDGMERRNFIQGVGLLAGVAAAAGLSEQPAFAQAAPQTEAKPMSYEARPFSLDPKTINGISEKVLISHYENNYVGAVKRLNAIGSQLAELDFAMAPTFVINGLKREELIAANSMILHEVYFDSLGGGGAPTGTLVEAIIRDFGSLDRWRTQFSAMGKAQGGGSGWVILAYSARDKRLLNQWAADHTTTLASGRPVLVLDMYEHAYHMDYGAAAARYVDAFMEAIRWDNAVKLYEQYSRQS